MCKGIVVISEEEFQNSGSAGEGQPDFLLLCSNSGIKLVVVLSDLQHMF